MPITIVMMIHSNLWRNHLLSCPLRKKGRAAVKCDCPVWCDYRVDGKRERHSLKTSNWERAGRKLARLLDPDAPPPAITVASAIKSYLADCQARNLAASTLRSYQKMLDHFAAFCSHEAYLNLGALTVDALMRFRNSRTGRDPKQSAKPSTLRKELQCLRAFCAFALECEWLKTNLAKKLKPPKESAPPTLPFEHAEVEKILRACDHIGNRETAHIAEARRSNRAFILLLLYSGLRISDAAGLAKALLNTATGHLTLRQMKTGVPLSVKLPESLIADLLALQRKGRYFFWTGTGKLSTRVGNLRQTIASVLKKAGVKGHPHRFRDTFAVDLLEQDVPIRTVQLLLGHTSVRTTEKHYAHFVKSQQRLLDTAVEKLSFGKLLENSPRELPKLPLQNVVRNAKRNVRTSA